MGWDGADLGFTSISVFAGAFIPNLFAFAFNVVVWVFVGFFSVLFLKEDWS